MHLSQFFVFDFFGPVNALFRFFNGAHHAEGRDHVLLGWLAVASENFNPNAVFFDHHADIRAISVEHERVDHYALT